MNPLNPHPMFLLFTALGFALLGAIVLTQSDNWMFGSMALFAALWTGLRALNKRGKDN